MDSYEGRAVTRIAVIGLGRMGRFHALTLARLGPRVETRRHLAASRLHDPGYRYAYAAINAGKIGRPVTYKGVGRDPAAASDDETPFFVRRFAAAYTAEIGYFVDCLEQGLRPSVGGTDAVAAIEIAQAATLSWQTGRPVALAELRASV